MALRLPAAFWWQRNCFQNVPFRTHLLDTHAVKQVACLHGNYAHFQQYCACGRTVSNTPKGLETSHRLFYSTNPNPEYGPIKRGWMKVSAMIKAFMSGTKALYGDMRQSFDLRVQKGSLKISTTAPTKDFPFSREQLQLIYKTRKDVRKMAPIVVFFFIPFVGYLALFAFVFPQWLLSSHFLTAEQREQFSRARYEARMQQFRTLSDHIKQSSTKEQLTCFANVKEKMLEESSQDWSELRRIVQDNPHFPLPLKELPWKYMSLLSSGWGLLSWLPPGYQRMRLKHHLAYVFCSDWLISMEGGVVKLSQEDVVLGCMERGLNMELGSEDMRVQLQQWVNISTQFKDCPISLLAHLPTISSVKNCGP